MLTYEEKLNFFFFFFFLSLPGLCCLGTEFQINESLMELLLYYFAYMNLVSSPDYYLHIDKNKL